MGSRGLILRIVRLIVLTAVLSSGLVSALAQGGPDATVRPDTLNMRTGPGSEYAVLVSLTRGAPLTLLAQDDVPMNGIWVWAQTADGVQGWVSSDYLDIRADFNLEALPIRAATETGNAPVAGETMPAESPAVTFPEGSGIPAQTTGRVNFRTGPGTNYRAMTMLAANTPALAKGRNAAGTWIFVSVNEQDGWVNIRFIRLTSGEVSVLPVVDTIVQPVAGPAESDDTGSVPAPVAGGAGITGFGYGGHVDSFAYPDLMHHAGMTWAKRQIRFRMGMSGGEAAGAINQAHANGFKILLGIVGYPEDMGAPGYYDDYARFVGEVAALGPDAIEVWNEMNIDREWPTGQIDPGRYTQLLAKSYNAIKSANPSVAVISGALSPTGAEGAFGSDRVWNDDRYLRGMAAAGAAQYMDCIGAHYNEGIVGPSQTSGDPRGDYYTRYFWGMVNTYWSAFGGARPICFTELGYVSPEGLGPLPDSFAWGANTSVAEQASWLDQAIRLARNSGKVRLVIIWNVDFTIYGGDPMAGYAIVRSGGSCPACDALGR